MREPSETQNFVMTTMATGVVVHGCHLQAEGWEGIVWGSPPAHPGRIPHGVLLALEADGGWLDEGAADAANGSAESIYSGHRGGCAAVVFGTGASKELSDDGEHSGDGKGEGRLEAVVTVDLLWERFGALREFNVFRDSQGSARPDEWWVAVKRRLEELIITEVTAQNTMEEIERGAALCEARGATKLVLVSSQTHISRCLRDGIRVLEEKESPLLAHLFASASATSYSGATVGDVVIMEPPHRGDRDKLPLHLLGKRMLNIPAERKADMMAEISAVLDKYGI